jgi:hypothetical protein
VHAEFVRNAVKKLAGETMKLNEILGELKKLDGDLNKLYSKRERVLKSNSMTHVDKMTLQELKDAESNFAKERAEKYRQIDAEIEHIKERIVDNKVLLMQRNQELGLNEKIIKLKMIRIELSKLMSLIDTDMYFMSASTLDSTVDELKINDKIKSLEAEKRLLDAEIQSINWNNSA